MKARPKRNPIPSEFDEQVKIIKWRDLMVATGQEPRLALLHGDSSGIRVSIGAAVKMKRAGRVRGWPDLILAVPCDGSMGSKPFHALFVELKRLDGRAEKEQSALHELLREQGYAVYVCRGSTEAIAVICEYLGIDPVNP